MASEKFIQRAIKHPGSLRRFAKRHRALDRSGDINLAKTKRAAMRLTGQERTRRVRQVNLAYTLRRLRA